MGSKNTASPKQQDEALNSSFSIDNVEVVRDLGYSHRNVMACSFLVFVLDIIINLDHGAMPAALATIQNDLKLTNTQMGGLGSMVFFGIVLGSASGAIVFKKFDYRMIILVSLLVNGVFLYLFTWFPKFYQLSLSRLIAGLSQVFVIIYKPVFVDTFASKTQKSYLMSLILVSPPLGVVFGYLLTALVLQKFDSTWRLSFQI